MPAGGLSILTGTMNVAIITCRAIEKCVFVSKSMGQSIKASQNLNVFTWHRNQPHDDAIMVVRNILAWASCLLSFNSEAFCETLLIMN